MSSLPFLSCLSVKSIHSLSIHPRAAGPPPKEPSNYHDTTIQACPASYKAKAGELRVRLTAVHICLIIRLPIRIRLVMLSGGRRCLTVRLCRAWSRPARRVWRGHSNTCTCQHATYSVTRLHTTLLNRGGQLVTSLLYCVLARLVCCPYLAVSVMMPQKLS